MKGLNIDRDKIGKVINENYASKFDISLEEKPNNLWVYKFKGTGIQPAILNVYYVNDGTTTLYYKLGANQDLSLEVATLIKDNCSIKEFKSNSFYLKSIRDVDFETILEYLALENEIENDDANDKGRIVKVKGKQGDKITLHHFSNGAFQAQGKPRMIFNDVIAILSEIMPFKDIVNSQLEFYETNLTADDILGELETRLPISSQYLLDKVKSVLSPSLALKKFVVELDDFSAFAFPVLRGLEGVLKQIYFDNGIVIGKEGFGDYLQIDSRGIGVTLKNSTTSKISCGKTHKAICDIYSFYSYHRHSLFHMDGTIETSKILNRTEAESIINMALNLIESSISSIKS